MSPDTFVSVVNTTRRSEAFMASQHQLREKITAQIIIALESGNVPPWRRPWRVGPNAGAAANVVSKKPYRGINPILLDLASARHGLTSKWWATFNQWKGLGGKVMRRPESVPEGQWGTTIVFWTPVTKTEQDAEGDEKTDRYFVMRSYTVFNVDQVEGGQLDHLRAGMADTDGDAALVIDYQPAEEAIAATGISIRYGGGQAYYNPALDFIQVPPKATFTEPIDYYETVLHELVHATEHPTRLNWSRKESDNSYAMGELVAEIGACYLARELGVPALGNLDNHVAYLSHWLQAMKNDSRFVFLASSQASKAADYLLSFSRQTADEPEEEAVMAC
jgi:antirestriction protein ArdC